MRKRMLVAFGLLMGLLVLSACSAATGTTATPVAGAQPNLMGFLLGVWHGLIAFFTLFIRLVYDIPNTIYQSPNIGGWYDFGFLLGVGLFYSIIGSFVGWVVYRGRSRRRPPV